jgi:hypothetical protein
MKKYSNSFKTLCDETKPTGNIGRGCHYSIFEAKDNTSKQENAFFNFAVIWDEDHDTRVIKVLEDLYEQQKLTNYIIVGERKGGFYAVLDPVKQRGPLNSLPDHLNIEDGDEWIAQTLTLNEVFLLDTCLIQDGHENVTRYINAILEKWQLGRILKSKEKTDTAIQIDDKQQAETTTIQQSLLQNNYESASNSNNNNPIVSVNQKSQPLKLKRKQEEFNKRKATQEIKQEDSTAEIATTTSTTSAITQIVDTNTRITESSKRVGNLNLNKPSSKNTIYEMNEQINQLVEKHRHDNFGDLIEDLKKLQEKIKANQKYLYQSPQAAAQKLFNEYLNFKLLNYSLPNLPNPSNNNNQATGVIINAAATYPRAIHDSNAIGLWGEETIYQFLKLKYQFEYASKMDDKNDGFELQNCKWEEVVKDTKKLKECPDRVIVKFPNKGKYDNWVNNTAIGETSKLPFDLEITKTYKNECLTKVRFDEVKATTHSTNDKAEFPMTEIRLIKNPDSYGSEVRTTNINVAEGTENKKYKSRIYNVCYAGQIEMRMEEYEGEALTRAINITNEQSASESNNTAIVGILVKFSAVCSKKQQAANSEKSSSSMHDSKPDRENAYKRLKTK